MRVSTGLGYCTKSGGACKYAGKCAACKRECENHQKKGPHKYCFECKIMPCPYGAAMKEAASWK